MKVGNLEVTGTATGTFGTGQEIESTTFVVAATNGNGCEDPDRGDSQCDGTADQTEINAAITALPA